MTFSIPHIQEKRVHELLADIDDHKTTIRIHILQKMSLRLFMNVPNLTHSAPLFKECQVMPIQDQVKFRTVTMVYKILHSLTPTYMRELFTYPSEMSTRNTMYSKVNKWYITKQIVCVRRRALRYNGCIEFNKLPSDKQDCKTLASFKYIMQGV